MDHIHRFRRSKHQAGATPVQKHPPPPPPPILTPPTDSSPSKLSPPGTPPSTNLNLPVPLHSTKPRKLSPFRNFHLRPSSHKRARDSPPASLPHSPATAEQRPRTAHAASSDGLAGAGAGALAGGQGETTGVDGAGDTVRMPGFLELGEKDVQDKFLELLWQERNRLAQSVTNPSHSFRWARVTGPHLRLLDRYVNIQPWQNNRVRLQVPEGEVDYINASPIVLRSTKRKDGGEEEEHRYIAMQGPKQVSVGHVWRMVAEQLASPGVIVMLTETHEVGVEKCWQYFPRQKGEVMKLGGVDEFADGWTGEVRCEEVSNHMGDAIEERKLVVRVWKAKTRGRQATPERNGLDMTREEQEDEADKMKSPTADIREGIAMMGELGGRQPEPTPTAQDSEPGDGEAVEEKVVYHFLYKKWPDFGVPALEDLDSFFALMRLSRERNASPSNPRVVHCSAGVGRSGTFIALEHLMRELDAGVLEDWDEVCAAGKAAKAEVGDGDGETLPDAVVGGEKGLEGDEEEGGLGGDGREDLIFDTVNALREQRRTMVQAEAQYAFIYQVMRKLWLERYGRGEGASGREGSGEPAAKRLEVDPFVVP